MFVSDNLKDTMNELKIQAPVLVKGISCIDHKKRIKLGLTCDEYVILETVDSLVLLGKKAYVATIEKEIGKIEDQLVFAKLNEMGLLLMQNGSYVCGLPWRAQFPHDDCFETLWKLFHVAGAKGNKKKALEAYKKAIKTDTMKNITTGAKAYIANKISSQSPFIMHLSSFLSPEYQYWRDDYSTGTANNDTVCKTS